MILPIRRRRAVNKQTKAEGSSCGAGGQMCCRGGGARQGTPLRGDLPGVGTHTSSVSPVHGDRAVWVYGSWSRAASKQPRLGADGGTQQLSNHPQKPFTCHRAAFVTPKMLRG